MTRCSNCGGTAFVPAIDNAGRPYLGCALCTMRVQATRPRSPELPRFSLRKLFAAHLRVNELAGDPSFVHPFTGEQLAMISYALGVLSAERIAASERLDDADGHDDDEPPRCSQCGGTLAQFAGPGQARGWTCVRCNPEVPA